MQYPYTEHRLSLTSGPGRSAGFCRHMALGFLAILGGLVPKMDAATPDPARLIVNLTVTDTSGLRAGIRRPARVALDFPALIAKAGLQGEADLATLRIVRLDEHGKPVATGARFAYAKDDLALPLRWDDEKVPDPFPVVSQAVSATGDQLRRKMVPRAGSSSNVLGEGKRGMLIWTHVAEGMLGATSHYRLEVAVRPEAARASLPPRGWIGDGVARFSDAPFSTTGSSHTRIDVGDWTDDGVPDIVYGDSTGRLYLMRNWGTAAAPVFDQPEFLTDAEGLPLDAGQTAAPFGIDWDGDGLKDLLVGTHWNRVLFFRNVGKAGAPHFECRGPLLADGKPLELPKEPVIGRPPGAFARDYYSVLATIDWDNNGTPDLLAGGYLTGRIYRFKIVGREKDGTPLLAAQGPIRTVDGEVLNVGDWGAAPAVADFTGDGLPDLISGNFPMSKQSVAAKTPLRFYRNVGTAGAPAFREEPFPREGEFPSGILYSPRPVSVAENAPPDLVVGSWANIYWFKNNGTRSEPKFRLNEEALKPRWGNTPFSVTQFLDWNHDGLPDMIYNYKVSLNTGEGDPFTFAAPESILTHGEKIGHASGIGDDWFHPRFFEFRTKGVFDLLFGDWFGQVWLHRKLADGSYDTAGELFKLESGEPIKVGPKGADTASFRALQGARTVFTAYDFFGTGKTDLVVGDTYGIIRHFANIGTNEAPVFRETQVIGDIGNRLSVDLIDWNEDGLMDVIAGGANGRVRVFLNLGKKGRFGAGIDPKIPAIPQPRIIPADLDGDGAVDLFLPSTEGSFWLQRAFLEHGYAEGVVESASGK